MGAPPVSALPRNSVKLFFAFDVLAAVIAEAEEQRSTKP